MAQKEIVLIRKKEAFARLPAIITKDDDCYYLTDDYSCFLKLNRKLPEGCRVLNLSGIFQNVLGDLRQPFLSLFAELGKKHYSLAWWGTHLASRNSASIPLLRNIVYLFCAGYLLDVSNNRRIIFVGESEALLDSIAKLGTERGYRIVHYRHTPRIFRCCKFWLIYVKMIINFLWLNSVNRRPAFSVLKPLPRKESGQGKKVVIRTWVTRDTFSEAGEFRDRNFGVLPSWLRSQGYDVWTLPLFFNLSGSLKKTYLLMKKQGDSYLIPDHYLKLIDYLQALRLGFDQLRMPLKNIHLGSMDVTLIFRETQMVQGFNPELLTLNLCYPMLKRLKELGVKIEKFYYPFENNAPEKPFILGVRRYFPESEIRAYQHTVWFRDQLGMFLSEDEVKFHPIANQIICSGPIYLNILREAGFPQGILKSGPNLRFAAVYAQKARGDEGKNQRKLVLLPLSFDINLAYELIFKVNAALAGTSDYVVCIRPHPLLSKDELKKFLSEIGMREFEFADEGTMQDWLLKSHVVISTGASVTILESAAVGVPVIRVIPDNTFFYDPLAWSPYPIKPVNKATEIRDSLDMISKMSKEDRDVFQEIGKKVLQDYFTPVDDNNLNLFL